MSHLTEQDRYMFKEALRTIYRVAKNAYQANIAFHRWCREAEETLVPELKTMAKTIRERMEGITSYWTSNISAMPAWRASTTKSVG